MQVAVSGTVASSHNHFREPETSPASRAPEQRDRSELKEGREGKKAPSVYNRVVMTSKSPQDSAKFSPTVTISFRDSFGRMFSRDSEEVTKIKKKLRRYIMSLQAEMALVSKATSAHSSHKDELTANLREQELQLKRWALSHLFRPFQLQAWLRSSRCDMMVMLSEYIYAALGRKVEAAQQLLDTILKSGKVTRSAGVLCHPYDYDSIEKFCVSPEIIVMSDSAFQPLQNRIILMDKICHRSLHKFRMKLPDLESKGPVERAELLRSILVRYNNNSKNVQPLVKSGETLNWETFIIWSMKKQSEQTEIEREYMSFVEDERETEGRLFRRWCILMNPHFIEDELQVLAVASNRSGGSSKDDSASASSAAAAVDRNSTFQPPTADPAAAVAPGTGPRSDTGKAAGTRAPDGAPAASNAPKPG
jgi:hypothetical protein